MVSEEWVREKMRRGGYLARQRPIYLDNAREKALMEAKFGQPANVEFYGEDVKAREVARREAERR